MPNQLINLQVPQIWIDRWADEGKERMAVEFGRAVREAPTLFCLWQIRMGLPPDIGWAYGKPKED